MKSFFFEHNGWLLDREKDEWIFYAIFTMAVTYDTLTVIRIVMRGSEASNAHFRIGST